MDTCKPDVIVMQIICKIHAWASQLLQMPDVAPGDPDVSLALMWGTEMALEVPVSYGGQAGLSSKANHTRGEGTRQGVTQTWV